VGNHPRLTNAASALAATQDGRPYVVVLAFILIDAEDFARRRHRHWVAAIGGAQHPTPPPEEGVGLIRRIQHPGEEGGRPGLLHTRQEGDVGLLAGVKKVPGALAPPSSKKARRLTEDAALQLEY
jgi:hypothetical protein